MLTIYRSLSEGPWGSWGCCPAERRGLLEGGAGVGEGAGQWQRAMVSMLRKRTCILVSMSIPCQIWNGRSSVRASH